MKKLGIILMCVLLALAMAGCGSGGSNSGGNSSANSTNRTDISPSDATSNSDTAPSYPQFNDGGVSERSDNAANESPSYSAETTAHDGQATTIPNTDEEYLVINENHMVDTMANPLLTFSLKVDTASYRNVVRYIESGNLPPADAVRTEEMVNYFAYEQPLEVNDTPFSIYTEIGASPFSTERKLAFIRVKSRDIDKEALPSSNLTFLIDVSGSMNSFDKLPLLKSAFGLLVETLDKNDTVSIVTYAGRTQVALDSARGNEKERIMNVINKLETGGSTAGASGIQNAYKLAEKNFVQGGNNRVILATDGDFNVGVSSVDELEQFIIEKRETGVYLSILGVGAGNIKDNRMETLAKNGNGNYNYLDTVATAKKVLVDELTSNLYVIADDVKAQVEFNPALVSDYRLIGYENRRLANRDFNDDTKDAGEIGVGTDVVLMFELTLKDGTGEGLKYGGNLPAEEVGEYGDEFFEVRIRYKDPGEARSQQITVPVKTDRMLNINTSDYNFAASVAAFGHLLRDSSYKGTVTLPKIIEVAEGNLGKDDGKLRKEFVQVLKNYQGIKGSY